MRRIWIIVTAVAVLTGLTGSPAVAGEPPVPLPTAPTGITSPVTPPAGIDPVSPYLPQVSCSPIDLAGPMMLRDLVIATYGIGGRGNISRGCTDGLSEHSEGRAWDWMVAVKDPAEKAAAADFIAWVTRDDGYNARRLGIMYVIYNAKIWSVYNTRAGWRKNVGHTDHVHISFSWNGARGNTSFWTGQVGTIDHGPCVRFTGSYAERTSSPRAKPCPRPTSALVRTSRGNAQYGRIGGTVKRGQAALGVPVTGRFDDATWTAVRNYQRAHDLPATGVLDQPTWASLDRGSVTRRVVKGYTPARAAKQGLASYSRNTLAKGRAAKAVALLQTALRLPVADRNGYFGAVTFAAVQRLQTRAGLEPDGIVQAEEWQALRAATR
ncbi:MAG: peptidoglycan-binding protein [Aeromicrobium sp.]